MKAPTVPDGSGTWNREFSSRRRVDGQPYQARSQESRRAGQWEWRWGGHALKWLILQTPWLGISARCCPHKTFKTLNKVERWIPLDRTFAAVRLLMVTWLTALWAVMGLLSFKVKMPKKKKKWQMSSEEDAALSSNRVVFCHLLQWKGNWNYHVWNYHWNRTKGLLTHWFKTAFLHWCMEPGTMRTGRTEPGELCFSHCIEYWFWGVPGLPWWLRQ